MSNYMLEDNIPSVHDDEFSGYEELKPLRSGKLSACKTKKRKKRDNSSIYAHNSSTRNMLGYLWSKHQIDKDYPEGTNTNSSIIKVMHIITKWKQEKIMQLLVEFIIEDCQPFHILQSKAFHHLLNYMEARFQIPCKQTVKKMIQIKSISGLQ
ncbi:2493_t:CDS:2 [Dentiscutata erythropus]|uniref:2493_t:CDS:1 n=1 Tax=Dentiscutata erythropus TaxID=1348616 RepID=A0A9N9NC46_9GLOM|nr:2493_t:CDS:2 [Dentiscutata erythropus]